MEPRLIQQQSQKMVLSPQIRQYLRLLQLPLAELQQAVEIELAENPVLEEHVAEPAPDEALPAERIHEKAPDEITTGESFESLNQMDENFKDSFQYADLSRQDSGDLSDRHNFQESLLTRPQGLGDYLMSQIRFLDLTESQKTIAQEIIGNIDEDGYLRVTVEEIVMVTKQSPEEVLRVLHRVQDLDPPGIAARNLQETLALQLKKKLADPDSHEGSSHNLELALKIIMEYLPLLEKRDYVALARLLSVESDRIKEIALEISKLDPKPGRNFNHDDSIVVTPDAAIIPDEDHEGKFKVEIHNEKIPEIRVNPYYRKLLRTKGLDEKSKLFLKEKVQSALNFMQAMNLRNSTLREITETIVKAQPEFLEKGFMHLKPLRLKDIANTIGIHESTVSRAIQGKYISTPQGMIPYKSFFSTRMETSEGPAESQKSLMEKIKQMMEKEDPAHPLSDQEIVELMKKDGAVVARRTIAKYRDILKILPSHMRRKK